jgi:hypothetical protein
MGIKVSCMDKNAAKPKPQDHNQHLIRITPVETDTNKENKSGKEQLTHMHWNSDGQGRYFPPNLSAEQLKPVLTKARVKLENVTLKDEEDYLTYRYKGRPLLKLNRKDGQFYSPHSEIQEFGKENVEHQAHMVLDIIKKAELSNATRGKTNTVSSARQILSNLRTYNKT